MYSKALLILASLGALSACGTEKPSGPVTVDGSDTVLPLSKAVQEAFVKENPEVQVTLAFSGTGGGFIKFCAGQTDLNGASRPINAAESAICKVNHVEYIEVPVAFDSLTVVVNPKNSFVECLTTQELKAIWEPAAEGKLTNWRQVRPSFPSLPLRLYGPDKASGTFDYFTFAINGTEAASRGDYAKSDDYTVVERGVESDANSLGYFGYAYYLAHKDQLKLVAIDSGHGCVLPNPQTVSSTSYVPLTRPLLIYVNQAAARRSEVRDFMHFYLALDSNQYVMKVGYIPLPANALAAELTRFDKGITGSALGGHGSVLGLKLDWFNVDEEDKINAQLVQ